MITRQLHNEALRKAGRERARKLLDTYSRNASRVYGEYKPSGRSLGEKERQAIAEHIRNENHRSWRRKFIAFTTATIVFGIIIYLLINHM